MASDTRRFYCCLLATTIAAVLLLPLAGLLWPRGDVFAATHHAGIKLMTLVLPHVPTPRLKVFPHSKIEHKIRVVKHLSPGAQVKKMASIAPASSAKASSSARATKLAVTPRKAKAERIASLPAPDASPLPRVFATLPLTKAPTITRVPAITAPIIAAPAASGVVAGNESSQGNTAKGEDTGKGSASGEGSGAGGVGKGQGAGGEPFGVGTGLPGLGGPRHVVYVLDTSGSMTSRIDRAREELRRTLSGLGPGETFNIVVFSDQVTPFAASLTSASALNIAQANHFLGTVQVDGGTNLEAAMREALELDGVNEVVLLTDGVPTVGETDFGKLAREIQKLNKNHARISAVGLLGQNPDGTDDSFEAEGLLRQITRSSGGSSEIVRLGTRSP